MEITDVLFPYRLFCPVDDGAESLSIDLSMV